MFKKILILGLSLISATVFAEGNDDAQALVVKQAISTFMQQNHVPGVAVELYLNGKPYSYYFGEANKETKKPVTNKTIFELGSLTKIMTCLLLADEVDAGKIQLDKSITDYLPSLPSEYEDITMLNLATHTSGLPFKPAMPFSTNAALEHYLQTNNLQNVAEEKWQYSNFGIEVIGLIIEKVEHRDINTLYRQRILNRLGMQPIGLSVPKAFQPYYAQGYDAEDAIAPRVPYNSVDSAGDARATPADMQKFLAASIGLPGTPEQILYPMRLMQTPFVTTRDFMQGLGWGIHEVSDDTIRSLLADSEGDLLQVRDVTDIQEKPVFDQNNLFDKTGMTDGFRSYMAVIPGKKTGIVILANKSVGGKPIVVAAREILFKLNHIEAKEPVVEDKVEDKNDMTSMLSHLLSA